MTTINQTKLAEAVRIVRERKSVELSDVLNYVVADWPNGDEHQEWIDNAPAAEIASWFLAGYTEEVSD